MTDPDLLLETLTFNSLFEMPSLATDLLPLMGYPAFQFSI